MISAWDTDVPYLLRAAHGRSGDVESPIHLTTGSSDSCHCAAVLASIASLGTLPLLLVGFEEGIYVDPASCKAPLESKDSLNSRLPARQGTGWC